MSKNTGDFGRKKGKDKQKATYDKFGKNTPRGLRMKQDHLEKVKEGKGRTSVRESTVSKGGRDSKRGSVLKIGKKK